MTNTHDSTHKADITVVGGGIIGCAVAFRLARAGLGVTVLDRGQAASEASGAAAGMIAPQGEMIEPESFSELCTSSRDLYPEFAAEVEEVSGECVNYRQDGSLLVAIEEHECEELEQVYRTQTQRGLLLERLTSDCITRRLPGLSPRVALALFVPGDHWVDNGRLTRALVKAGEVLGVKFHWNCNVTKFNTEGDQVKTLRAILDASSAEALFSADRFILSAGCWSGQVAETLGLTLPVQPCYGEMIEFGTPSDLPHVVRAGMHYVVPRGQHVAVGGTTARWGRYEKSVTAGGLNSIIQGILRFLPVATEFKFRSAWAGLRPDTKDHLPVLGFGKFRNLIFATGHFRNGILLAPITAKLVAELILTGIPSQSLDPYSPDRFKAA